MRITAGNYIQSSKVFRRWFIVQFGLLINLAFTGGFMKYVLRFSTLVFLMACQQSSTSGNLNGSNLAPFIDVDLTQAGSVSVNQVQETASLGNKMMNIAESFIESIAAASSTNQVLTAMVGSNEVAVHLTVNANGSVSSSDLTAYVAAAANTTKFLVVRASGILGYNGNPCLTIFIAKSNGATQCNYRAIKIVPGTALTVQSDASGRYLFYLDNASSLYRWDTMLATETLLGNNIEEFAVNFSGDVLAANNQVTLGQGTTSQSLQLYFIDPTVEGLTGPWITPTANGGTVQQIGSIATIDGSGAGPHFGFTTYPADAAGGCGGQYCLLVKSGNTFSLAGAQYEIPLCEANTLKCNIGWALTFEFVNQNTGVANFSSNNSTIYLVNPDGSVVSGITGTRPASVQYITGSNYVGMNGQNENTYVTVQSLAVDGTTGLYRYHTGDGTYDTILEAGAYSITSFDTDNLGNTTIAATQVSNGQSMIVTVPPGSTVVTPVNGSAGSNSVQIAVLK
jgi:hypothetical protein